MGQRYWGDLVSEANLYFRTGMKTAEIEPALRAEK